MHMASIAKAGRPASSPALRVVAGVATLAVPIAAMLPWLAVNGAVSVIVVGALALTFGPRASARAMTYADEVALGR